VLVLTPPAMRCCGSQAGGLLRPAKLAFLWDTDDMDRRERGQARGIVAVFKGVDNLAAGIRGFYPFFFFFFYYYSPTNALTLRFRRRPSRGGGGRAEAFHAKQGAHMILGGGRRNRIGQGIESSFIAAAMRRSRSREAGYETIRSTRTRRRLDRL